MGSSHMHNHANDNLIAKIGTALHLPGFGHHHEHGYADMAQDSSIQDNDLGIRTVWLALLILGVTTVLQIVIYLMSGSIALLADTVHNLGDALNSVPLLIALYLSRRVATKRYTYGFGRAEDIAGVLIVLSIAFSAGYILYETTQRLINPEPLTNIGWVAVAAIVGFIGNELVALMQINVGHRIGSDAMIADGQHARVDGLTSLAVLGAVFGTWIGLPILDPIIGIVIAIAIIGITWNATKSVWYRLMDAVDPGIITRMEHFASEIDGVIEVSSAQARWIGHRVFAELEVVLEHTLSISESHTITENIRHRLKQATPHLSKITIHVIPDLIGDKSSRYTFTNLTDILPPRYQLKIPSAAPMGAAGLKYADDGSIAWNEIWTDFCDLALAGGPPHRGRLLEPVDPEKIEQDPDGYQNTLDELERGLRMVTGLDVVTGDTPGWIGIVCDNEDMALWLLRAIVVENISVRREAHILYFPAGADFTLEKEIKNVITVVAKTTHYWQEHIASK